MKRRSLSVLVLSAATVFATSANAQEAAPATGLSDSAETLREFVVKPGNRFPATFIPSNRFAAKLESSGLASIGMFSDELYSAEYVLSQGEEIGLSAAQRRQIIDIEADSQARLTRQRLENEGSDGRLDALLEAHPIDADAALAELDRLLETERGPKREQLATLIAVRNVLTKDQFDQLSELRQPLRIQFLERAPSLLQGD
ncbi:MAG: hypothetical protein AAF692_11085 [Pseudomonadota bacterium]